MQPNTAPRDGSLWLFDGVGETSVTAVAAHGISLANAIAQRAGRFILIWRGGASRIEVPLLGKVAPDGLTVESETGTLGSELGRASGDRMDVALVRSAFAAAPEVLEGRHGASLLLRLLLVALILVLGIYDAMRLYHAVVTITPRVAFLATEVSTINAPTSGTLAFVAGKGQIGRGEPVIGIENARGKTILVDAADDARIISVEHAIGDRIRRGDPLLAIAAPNPPIYISAIVSREQAFQLTHGVTAHYALLDGGQPQVIDLFIAGDQLSLTVLPEASNGSTAPLYQARFRIDAENVLTRGAPVYLEFERSLSDSIAASLGTAGLTPEQAALLLRPVIWLEALLLPSEVAR
ncbi:MAG TPA: hypothetical protein VG757_15960 [Devosia sp.]|nr:hypothetical protein [Devosia sp.]